MSEVVYYSQNREDIILRAFLKEVEKGFYVDIGANHPDEDSVTKLFYNSGWRGINIEPIKSLYNLLEKRRKRDINLNCAIGLTEAGSITFREYDIHGWSTPSEQVKFEHGSTKHRDYQVPVRRLDNILAEIDQQEIDFLKVDVEGFEYEVIASNNWKSYRPKVICIEHSHVDDRRDWRGLLAAAGYSRCFDDGLNDYWVANEHPYIADGFDYAHDIIEAGHGVHSSQFEQREQLVKRITELDQEKASLLVDIDQLKGKLLQLQQELEQAHNAKHLSHRIKRSIKRVTKDKS